MGVKVTLKKWFPGAAACVVRTQDIVESISNAVMKRVAVLLNIFIFFTLLLIYVV